MTHKKYALLGYPVKHSVSPQMQEAGFKALGIDASYGLVEVHPDDFAGCIEKLKNDGYSGWNVTIPHKEQMAEIVDEISVVAKAAGSVNTVIHKDGKLIGESTDGIGMAQSVKESFGLDLKDKKVVFIGTGGAARAVSVYFSTLGVKQIALFNRTVSRAQSVAEAITQASPDCHIICEPLNNEEVVKECLADADLVLQCTSLGLHEGDPMPVDPEYLRTGCPVVDMVYGNTAFQKKAEAKGCPVIDGSGMLLYQGTAAFSCWTGCDAPVEAMRNGLQEALANRG